MDFTSRSGQTFSLLKNGVYYPTSSGKALLDYLELLNSTEGRDTLSKYIDYRLELTGEELVLCHIDEIKSRYIKSLELFREGQLTPEINRNLQLWPYMPTYLLLTMGGDDRSILDPSTLKNKYHTSTLPYYDVQRSSCTSSSVSMGTYLWLEQEHFVLMAKLIKGELDLNEVFLEQRSRIASYFIQPSETSKLNLITTPSGTDVEMIGTWLGIFRAKELGAKEKVKVYVNGSLEVGSGTVPACGLEHFSTLTPQGRDVTKGTLVECETVNLVDVRSFAIRGERTQILSREELLFNEVSSDIANGNVVVFHYVHSSKTGVPVPDFSVVSKLKKQFGERVVVIVDAAQTRLKSDSVQEYLDQNMNIVVTGSKFVGGPPFSGAMILCDQDQETFSSPSAVLPASFGEYFDHKGLSGVVQIDQPSPWTNWGVFLRWEAALHEMNQYDNIPTEFSNKLIEHWVQEIHDYLDRGHVPIRILKEDKHLPEDESSLSHVNSIIPIEVLIDFNLDQLKGIQKKMCLKRHDKDIVCEIGQPVRISTGDTKRFALRIALGAKNIIDAYYGSSGPKLEECLEHILNNDRRLLSKFIEIIKEESDA